MIISKIEEGLYNESSRRSINLYKFFIFDSLSRMVEEFNKLSNDDIKAILGSESLDIPKTVKL